MAARSDPDKSRPIVVRKVRRGAAAGHHGGAWKVAYADFVTAMMAFFMLLWLISNPDKEKLKGLAEYFSPSPPSAPASTGQAVGSSEVAASGGHTLRTRADAREGKGEPAMLAASPGIARGGSADVPDASLRVAAEELRLALAGDGTGAAPPQIESTGDTLRVSIADDSGHAMFANARASLSPWGRMIAGRVVRALMPTALTVAIEGHTSGDGRGSDASFRLSGDRAAAMRRAMVDLGFPASRLGGLTALADTRPVDAVHPQAPGNRRITFVLSSPTGVLPRDPDFRF